MTFPTTAKPSRNSWKFLHWKLLTSFPIKNNKNLSSLFFNTTHISIPQSISNVIFYPYLFFPTINHSPMNSKYWVTNVGKYLLEKWRFLIIDARLWWFFIGVLLTWNVNWYFSIDGNLIPFLTFSFEFSPLFHLNFP